MGLAVMAAALRIPKRYFRTNNVAMAAVLVPGLVAMWLVSGGLAYALLDVPLWIALLIGAIVTPTDPVLTGTIGTGHLRSSTVRLREVLHVACETAVGDVGPHRSV
ncbi:cation:proton antiporter domain-containing protein [Haloterrigena salifodinae]|uniref:cation:proton antiporter domain-containing protein n=1 Tax=Haloterrigena salifodinae TaxID=2675099 RepID=UPI0020127C83|nr:cation:proton antiporter [Haloterrigena salifodinae]